MRSSVLAAFSKMLEKANVEAVLAELEKIDETTMGNLIAFMHTYNLRFGQATTPHQRDAYRELSPVMVATRDKLLGKPDNLVHAIFEGPHDYSKAMRETRTTSSLV